MSKKVKFAQELRDKTFEELDVLSEDLRKELFNIRNQRVMDKKAENVHKFRLIKKQIAQVLTIVHEKQKTA
jgi:ribosomal protein L29